MIRGVAIFAALAVLATPASATAAELRDLAVEAVRELCPDLLEIETPLAEEPQIKALGYVATATRNHPRGGQLDMVERKADDGSIWIANSRDASFCQVGLEGDGARAAFESLLAASHEIDETLVPDTASSSPNPQLRMVSLRTPAIDGVVFGIQFVDASALKADAPLIIQQYLFEE